MEDVEIRRLFMPDKCWERTSPSWKALKPFRNFNEFSEKDETAVGCFERLKIQFNIPLEVIEQWLYPLYYDPNSVNNYGWIDYSKYSFVKNKLSIKTFESLNVIKKYESYVQVRAASKPFSDFMCTYGDKEYWKEHSTWRVPPIVIDVRSLKNIPEYSEISGQLQLIEGHSRLGYLLAMHRTGMLKRKQHEVYILKMARKNT